MEAFGTLAEVVCVGGGTGALLGAAGLADGGTAAPGARVGNLRAVDCAVLEALEPIFIDCLLLSRQEWLDGVKCVVLHGRKNGNSE